MNLAEARKILDNSEKHSKNLVNQAKEVVDKSLTKAKEELKEKKTGRLGTMDAQQAKSQKTQMAYGGTAMGKKHFYVAGGSVTLNPGLLALRRKSPEAFSKITKGKTVKMGD